MTRLVVPIFVSNVPKSMVEQHTRVRKPAVYDLSWNRKKVFQSTVVNLNANYGGWTQKFCPQFMYMIQAFYAVLTHKLKVKENFFRLRTEE